MKMLRGAAVDPSGSLWSITLDRLARTASASKAGLRHCYSASPGTLADELIAAIAHRCVTSRLPSLG